jgi:trimethylamine--corrinoid protein Co-methyltransferase
MLNFESAQSFEKVVIDTDIIGMGRRLVAGIEAREEPIALTLMREMGHKAEYLASPHTHRWFRRELFFPSEVVDRSSLEEWEKAGAKSAFERASERVEKLVQSYRPVPLPDVVRQELDAITLRAARPFGMDELPPLIDG